MRGSITTFGVNVASLLPGQYEAYARVFHPFDDGALGMTWRALAALHGRQLESAADGVDLALFGVPEAQARVAVMPGSVVEPLIERLRGATDTPNDCRFAVWDGRQSAISHLVPTVLHLPAREYYLFAGPIAGARASYDGHELGRTTANLWWPEDRAW